jgi:Plasmid stabilisation system protein.
MGYSFSNQAIEDLAAIYQAGLRISAQLPPNANWTIIDAAELVAQFPPSVALRPERDVDVRVRPVGSHLLIYRFDDPNIVVVRDAAPSSGLAAALVKPFPFAPPAQSSYISSAARCVLDHHYPRGLIDP